MPATDDAKWAEIAEIVHRASAQPPPRSWNAIMAQATKPGPPRVIHTSDLMAEYQVGQTNAGNG